MGRPIVPHAGPRRDRPRADLPSGAPARGRRRRLVSAPEGHRDQHQDEDQADQLPGAHPAGRRRADGLRGGSGPQRWPRGGGLCVRAAIRTQGVGRFSARTGRPRPGLASPVAGHLGRVGAPALAAPASPPRCQPDTEPQGCGWSPYSATVPHGPPSPVPLGALHTPTAVLPVKPRRRTAWRNESRSVSRDAELRPVPWAAPGQGLGPTPPGCPAPPLGSSPPAPWRLDADPDPERLLDRGPQVWKGPAGLLRSAMGTG